jgi:hypothetical protein
MVNTLWIFVATFRGAYSLVHQRFVFIRRASEGIPSTLFVNEKVRPPPPRGPHQHFLWTTLAFSTWLLWVALRRLYTVLHFWPIGRFPIWTHCANINEFCETRSVQTQIFNTTAPFSCKRTVNFESALSFKELSGPIQRQIYEVQA